MLGTIIVACTTKCKLTKLRMLPMLKLAELSVKILLLLLLLLLSLLTFYLIGTVHYKLRLCAGKCHFVVYHPKLIDVISIYCMLFGWLVRIASSLICWILCFIMRCWLKVQHCFLREVSLFHMILSSHWLKSHMFNTILKCLWSKPLYPQHFSTQNDNLGFKYAILLCSLLLQWYPPVCRGG